MKSVWLKGYSTSESKEARKQQVRSFQVAFDELKKILESDYKKKDSVRDYEVPGWEHRQIAANEYNQVLDDVLKLITIKES